METETVDNILLVRGAFNDEPLAQFWGGGSPFKFVEACVSTRPQVYDTNCVIPVRRRVIAASTIFNKVS